MIYVLILNFKVLTSKDVYGDFLWNTCWELMSEVRQLKRQF